MESISTVETLPSSASELQTLKEKRVLLLTKVAIWQLVLGTVYLALSITGIVLPYSKVTPCRIMIVQAPSALMVLATAMLIVWNSKCCGKNKCDYYFEHFHLAFVCSVIVGACALGRAKEMVDIPGYGSRHCLSTYIQMSTVITGVVTVGLLVWSATISSQLLRWRSDGYEQLQQEVGKPRSTCKQGATETPPVVIMVEGAQNGSLQLSQAKIPLTVPDTDRRPEDSSASDHQNSRKEQVISR